MSSEISIEVSNISKKYRIYDAPSDRLKQYIYPKIANFLGLPTKQYCRESAALENITFNVKKGETVGVIGKNGSGKSTLLQIICGTLQPSSGTVKISGRVAALLELGSGFNPEFSGKENVYLNATVLGLTTNEIDKKYDAIIRFADIGEYIDRPVKTYSTGMAVRLAFSVIAHVDADILIIDEALSVGDTFFVQKCMRFLRKFMEHGTVLFVSHDTGAILNLCNKAVLLEKGQMKTLGEPNNIVEQYLLSSVVENEFSMPKKPSTGPSTNKNIFYRDMRADFINDSNLRNDMKIISYHSYNNDEDLIGKGGVKLLSVSLLDQNAQPLAWVVGGEDNVLSIKYKAITNLENYIVGFQVKDRLGQTIFGDNTFLTYISNTRVLKEGDQGRAEFSFIMPVLPQGDYSISVAFSEGTQEEHTILNWIHDALALEVRNSSIALGLVKIPMYDIQIYSDN